MRIFEHKESSFFRCMRLLRKQSSHTVEPSLCRTDIVITSQPNCRELSLLVARCCFRLLESAERLLSPYMLDDVLSPLGFSRFCFLISVYCNN
jgi:hypothetical protein